MKTNEKVLIELEEEFSSLKKKIDNLALFIYGESEFNKLNDIQKNLLRVQRFAMISYSECLRLRISDLKITLNK